MSFHSMRLGSFLFIAMAFAAASAVTGQEEELPPPRVNSNEPLPMAMASTIPRVPVPAYFAPMVPRPAGNPWGPTHYEAAYYVPTMPVWTAAPAVTVPASHPHCRRKWCHHRHHAVVPALPAAAIYPVWPYTVTRGPRDFLYPGY